MSHVSEALQEAFKRTIGSRRLLCLVLDTAHAEGAFRELDRQGIRYLSLFDQTAESQLIEIAPLLICAQHVEAGRRQWMFDWTEQLAYAAPCVSWFTTHLSEEAVAASLRRFHLVGLSEGQVMLLRWYDTRILPVLLACLTTVQARDFAAGTAAWHYVDRFGHIAKLPTDGLEHLPPQPLQFGALSLDEEQYEILVDAADLDVLVSHLKRIIPDELSGVPARGLMTFVARCQQAARQVGLNDLDRQIQFVLLALYTSGDGIEHPLFKKFIKSPPRTLDEFTKQLQALPDDVWNAGPPLWEPSPRSESGSEQVDA